MCALISESRALSRAGPPTPEFDRAFRKSRTLPSSFVANVAMSRVYGWRAGCPATGMTAVDVGSVEWFGSVFLFEIVMVQKSGFGQIFVRSLLFAFCAGEPRQRREWPQQEIQPE